jgi:hypothetical protein
MTSSITLRVRGLVDSHELAEQPGALTRAEDVIVEPGGSLSWRPGFLRVSETGFGALTADSTLLPRALIPYDGSVVTTVYSSADAQVRAYRLATLITGTVNPPDSMVENAWIVARKNLYISTTTGWDKITSASSTEWTDAGIEWEVSFNRRALMIQNADASEIGAGALAPKFTGNVAYRLVIARRDANGYLARSRPSAAFVTNMNTIGGLAADEVVANSLRYEFRGLRAGDIVEWYRTRGSGAAAVSPASSCYLVATYTVSGADITLVSTGTGFFYNPTQYDLRSDDELGAALYTNPEREGIAKAKYEPPIARAAAEWQRCAWYANTTSKYRRGLTLKRVGRVLRVTGNVSTGSNSITNVPSLPPGVSAAEMVGWYVCDSQTKPNIAGTRIPAATRVTGVTGSGPYTIAMSNGASGTATGVAFSLCDWFFTPTMLVCTQNINVVFTAGSTTVSGLTSTTGFIGAEYVSEQTNTLGPFVASTYLQAGTRMVAYGATTITLDKAALASGTASIYVHSRVPIDGQDFVPTVNVLSIFPSATDHPQASRATRCFALIKYSPAQTLINLRQAVARALYLGEVGVRVVLTGEENAYGANATGDFTVEEFGLGRASAPALSIGSGIEDTTAGPVTNDSATNRLAWSAPDEPEAVPLVNFVDVGTTGTRILRLVPLRTSMLVFTTSGLYRVTGAPPDAWAIDLIDPTLQLLSEHTVDVIDNAAFAWTTRGVLRVDESGSTDISTGAVGKRLLPYQTSVDIATATADPRWSWVTCWKERQLVIVGASKLTNGEIVGGIGNNTSEWFVYNTVSQAWSTWSRRERRAISVRRSGATADELWSIRGDRFLASRTGTPTNGFDVAAVLSSFTHTLGTNFLTVTSAGLAYWRPRAGDYLLFVVGGSSYVWRRITQAFGTSTWSITLSRATPVGGTVTSLIAFESVSVDVEWAPMSVGSLPGVHARWREACVTLDVSGYSEDMTEARGPRVIEPGFSFGSTTVTQQATRKLVTLPVGPSHLELRFGVPRSTSRSSVVRPRFQCVVGGFLPRVVGFTMHRSDAGERVRR